MAGSARTAGLGQALRALVQGFDDADRQAGGDVVGARTSSALQHVFAGLVTVLGRVRLLAHAGERALPGGVETPSPAALHAELDAARRLGAPLASRFEAWPRLTATFRAVHRAHGGGLFDPAAFPFLERGTPSDAAVLRLLDALLGAAHDPIPWAEVEVEELGATYEALVGLELRAAPGDLLVLLPDHTGVDLDALLAVPPAERASRLAALIGDPVRARLSAALARAETTQALQAALRRRVSPRWPELVPKGALFVEPGEARRRAGAHYTPRAITRTLVERTLRPLLDLPGADVLDLRICDPAMGSGAFLVEACRQLGDHLAARGVAEGRRLVAERCLHGVDQDPLAVELARASLWLVAGAPDLPMSFADRALQRGDALVGEGPPEGPTRAAVEALCRGRDGALHALHWPEAFPEVLGAAASECGWMGFDAVLGNPPWVAYAGRAAQPLSEDVSRFYERSYSAFRGYRTLHGLFVQRAASLLRPGGRLGLCVPTSLSDLQGYEPTRRAHDALAEVDPELPDFGDAFEGVFQPSMGLLSTRLETPRAVTSPPWRVARDDLGPRARALLDRLAALPTLPATCFGERGYQTTPGDADKLVPTLAPAPPFVVPIREGADLRAFRALPPRLHLDPSGLNGKLRAPDAWREVAVIVRQTARFPIAALADGVAFRNSILAGFAAPPVSGFVLCAWLNASPVRWLHFMRQRDARQGMPQVKIAHLRALPRVPDDHVAAIAQLGEALGTRNAGVSADEQRALDDAAARALGLSDEERALVAGWAATNPAP